MKRHHILLLLGAVVTGIGLSACAGEPEPEMVVYLTPTCGCCGDWTTYMEENGFAVRVVERPDLRPIREELGVPSQVATCHLGVVDGYVVEGHVPADAVHRLLSERPDVRGIVVPGMPAGSPGMETADGRRDAYGIYTFDSSGTLGAYGFRN